MGGDKPVLAITYLLFDTLNAISKNTSADHDIIQVLINYITFTFDYVYGNHKFVFIDDDYDC